MGGMGEHVRGMEENKSGAVKRKMESERGRCNGKMGTFIGMRIEGYVREIADKDKRKEEHQFKCGGDRGKGERN